MPKNKGTIEDRYCLKSYFAKYGIGDSDPENDLRQIDEQTMPYSQTMLRQGMLRSLGIRGHEESENVVLTGCVSPFYVPFTLRNYFRLLDALGIDYKVLDEEHCCGANSIYRVNPDEMAGFLGKLKAPMRRNVDAAKAQGAKKLYYWCYSCVSQAQLLFNEDDFPIRYGLDILIEPMKKAKLKAKPAIVGYYSGCWRRLREINPKLELSLDSYRSWVDQVEGIEVVDIPSAICCTQNPEAIFRKARAANVDYMVTPCMGCSGRLNVECIESSGRLDVERNSIGTKPIGTKPLYEFLLESLVT